MECCCSARKGATPQRWLFSPAVAAKEPRKSGLVQRLVEDLPARLTTCYARRLELFYAVKIATRH